MADYDSTRDRCMASPFQLIAEQHHVTPQQASGSINTRRRTSLDVAVMLSFGLLYAAFVNRFVRGILAEVPTGPGPVAGNHSHDPHIPRSQPAWRGGRRNVVRSG